MNVRGDTLFGTGSHVSNVPVPGYDPDDLDDVLRTRLEDPERRKRLSEEERAAYERGDDLVEALDEETIDRIVS